MSQSPHSLSPYWAEHTRILPKTEKLSEANQNRARETLICKMFNIHSIRPLQLPY